MSADRVRELGRKFLDGVATPDEAAELSRLVAASPGAADAFARLARFEADLSAEVTHDRDTRRVADELAARFSRADAARRLRTTVVRYAVAASLFLVAGVGVFLAWPRAEPAHRVVSGTVKVGDVVVTTLGDGETARAEGRAVVRFASGSTAEVDGGTTFRVSARPDVVSIDEGGGRFSSPSRPLRVDTPAGWVLGGEGVSEFTVSLSADVEDDEMSMTKYTLAVMVAVGTAVVGVGDDVFPLAAGASRAFAADGDKREGDKGDKRGGERDGAKRFRVTEADAKGVAFAHVGDGGGKEELAVEAKEIAEVVVDGKPAKVSDLQRGMSVLASKTAAGKWRVVTVGARAALEVKSVGPKSLTVAGRPREGGGAAVDTVFEVDAYKDRSGNEVKVKAGDKVTVELSWDRKRIVTFIPTRPERGREKGERGKTVRGVVKAFDARTNAVTLAARGETKEATYPLAKDVKVSIGRKEGAVADVKAGVAVQLMLTDDGKAVKVIAVVEERKRREGDK